VWEKGPDTPTAAPADRPPNIILIVADDLGYNDITLGGGGVANGAVPTPNIDSIAKDGANLTQSYAGNATCAPSRAAIMTGRYATRFGFEFTPVPVQFARLLGHMETNAQHPPIYHAELEKDVPVMAEMTVPTSETTLPQMLKTKGYRTLMLGKWHLGEPRPRVRKRAASTNSGFRRRGEVLPAGDPNGRRAPRLRSDRQVLVGELALRRRQQPTRPLRAEGLCHRLFSDVAAKAIDANKNRPFFAYWPTTRPTRRCKLQVGLRR
jgi:arylsulfatase A-like enzyme